MRNQKNDTSFTEREEYFKSLFSSFESRHYEHIKNYGSQNDLRLTGQFETQSIDKFTWGVSDRGASIRVPQSTAEDWTGYLEDRRPGSNADPYKIINQIVLSLKNAEAINEMKYKINYKVDVNDLDKKYGTLTSNELLNEYQNDEDYLIDSETMKGSNIPTEEIKFDLNGKQ